jgi:hypothetical protein
MKKNSYTDCLATEGIEHIEPCLNWLSITYGVDKIRANTVLRKLDEFQKDLIENGPFIVEPSDLDWTTALHVGSLESALQYLKPEEALSLFENTDFKTLSRYVTFVNYLRDLDMPLYNRHELVKVMHDFTDYLEQNKESLLQTGYPEARFSKSFWLGHRLGQHYYDHFPIALDEEAISKGELGYVFADHTRMYMHKVGDIPGRRIRTLFPLQTYLFEGNVYLETGHIVQVVSDLSQVPKINEIEGWPTCDLNSLRKKVFDAKAEVVREITSALRQGNHQTLWEKSLKILTNHLEETDMRLLLEMDTFSTDYDFTTGMSSEESMTYLPTGGVSDLLTVIGHCEYQLKNRIWESIRKAIPQMVHTDLAQLRRLNVRNYYEAVACGFGDAIQMAYDIYNNAVPEEKEFQNDYRDRVNDAIEQEFHVEFNLPSIRLPRKNAHEFNLNKHLLSEDISTFISATGNCPRFPAFNESKVVQEDVFRLVGDLWEVVYGGKSIYVPNLDGMHYIKALLESPKKEIRVDDLYRIAHPPKSLEKGSGVADREAIEEKFDPMSDFGSQIKDPADQELIDETIAKMRECSEELDRAVGCNNQKRARELESELHRYQDYLKRFADHKMRPRSNSDPHKKSRQKVSNAIEMARKKLEKIDPRLASHLELIKLGTNCVYTSSQSWKTQ